MRQNVIDFFVFLFYEWSNAFQRKHEHFPSSIIRTQSCSCNKNARKLKKTSKILLQMRPWMHRVEIGTLTPMGTRRARVLHTPHWHLCHSKAAYQKISITTGLQQSNLIISYEKNNILYKSINYFVTCQQTTLHFLFLVTEKETNVKRCDVVWNTFQQRMKEI